MLIENRYFIPDGLYHAICFVADRERKSQCVGVLHQSDSRLPPGLARLESVWTDLITGKNCAWIYGPGRDELASKNPAVILWIPPMRLGVEA